MKSTDKLKNKFILNCGVEDYLKSSCTCKFQTEVRVPDQYLNLSIESFLQSGVQFRFAFFWRVHSTEYNFDFFLKGFNFLHTNHM